MKIRDIQSRIDSIVPLKLAQSWDNVGLLVGHRHGELFQTVRGPVIVSVEKRHTPAMGMFQTQVACGVGPQMVLEQQCQARGITCGKLLQDAHAAVGRAVIHDNQFDIGIGLIHHAIDGLLNKRGGVVARHDDADAGRDEGFAHGRNSRTGTLR